MEVIEDSLTLISTHIVNDSDVRSGAISQAYIDQDWLPAHHQINHVHWSNTMERMCVYIGECLLLQAIYSRIWYYYVKIWGKSMLIYNVACTWGPSLWKEHIWLQNYKHFH